MTLHTARGGERPRLWRFVVDIFEEEVGADYPVLRHVFYGKTQEEARGIFDAHMSTDAFLRGCVEKRRWDGVRCWASYRWVAPGETMDDY